MNLDVIRKRPGMYIGDTVDGTGLHHMLWEVVSNCIDEHLAGHCHRVEVILHPDDSVTVRDDGRGISLDPQAGGVRCAELVLTTLHAGATSDGHYPHSHVGLLGVGLAVVNALSEWLEVQIDRDGGRWVQAFARGVPSGPLRQTAPIDSTGTAVRFRPDPQVFGSIELSYEQIQDRLIELAALSNGLVFDLRDERLRTASLQRPGGVADLLPAHSSGEPPALGQLSASAAEPRIDVAARWMPWIGPVRIASFVNMTRTREGSHVDGLLRGLADSLSRVVPATIARRQVRSAVERGLEAVVHVVVVDPAFAGPTKDRLEHPGVERAVRQLLARQPFDRRLARKLLSGSG